jgi:hypothetical protein
MTATHAPALLTATRYEVRWTTHAGAPGVTYCATPEAADKWADTIRLNGRSSAVEVVTVEVSVAVGDYVTVRAYGRKREGRVVELNRSRAVVEFVRNASGEKATRAFSVATEVQLVAKGEGRLAAEQAVAEVVEDAAPTVETVAAASAYRVVEVEVRRGETAYRVVDAHGGRVNTYAERDLADATAEVLNEDLARRIAERVAEVEAIADAAEPAVEDDEEPADGAAPGQDAAGVSDPHVPAQLAHLMGDDLLAACGSTGDALGLYVVPSSTPERVTCPACRPLLQVEQIADAILDRVPALPVLRPEVDLANLGAELLAEPLTPAELETFDAGVTLATRRLAERYGTTPEEVARLGREVIEETLDRVDEPGPEVDDPREEPRPLEWSEVASGGSLPGE